MNKDQIKGGAKEAAGKVQRKVGELVGSPGNEAEGAARELGGKAQKKVGDLKQAVKEGQRKV